MTRREEFIDWLEDQIGGAYVWGAQGHRIKNDGRVYLHDKEVSHSYTHWINLREDSPKNAGRATAFVEAKLAKGEESIPCYDCSGLVMAYMRDVKNYLKCDMTSRAIFTCCEEIAKSDLISGDLVFRHNGERIAHVGVYIGDGLTIDSRGRDVGVIKTTLDSFDWNRFGRLRLMDIDDDALEKTPFFALCGGGSVYVRNAPDISGDIITVAHKGDRLLAKKAQDGWCAVAMLYKGKMITGYMSAKYTQTV